MSCEVNNYNKHQREVEHNSPELEKGFKKFPTAGITPPINVINQFLETV